MEDIYVDMNGAVDLNGIITEAKHVIDYVTAMKDGTVMEDGIVMDKTKADQIEEEGGWSEDDSEKITRSPG